MLVADFSGFLILRRFGDRERMGSHSAVLAILGAITVPIVVYSVKILPQAAQLHPVIVENRGLKDPLYLYAFFFSDFALVVLQFALVWLRYRIALTEIEIENRELE